MIFYDFEVFKHDWLVVAIDPKEPEPYVIINNKAALEKLYSQYKADVWVGFNSRNYDQWILKCILCDMDPKALNDWIIKEDKKPYLFSSLLNRIHLINFDVMPNPPVGLKTMEGFMGSNIKETDVDFDIDRPLTQEEITETVKYCRHDVEQTIEVFVERINVFHAMMGIIKAFDLPLSYLGKTDAQMTAVILDAKKVDWPADEEWKLFVFDTIRLDKYKFVADWFMNPKNQRYKVPNKNGKMIKNQLEVEVCGVPHVFGWGGLHGAPKEPVHRKGLLLHVDVTSYYPSMLIVYNLVSRAARHPEQYKKVYDTRVELKKAGKKKEQEPYKKILNSMSGAMKDPYNPLYDPRNNNLMCVNGQLMLLDLLEHLEGHCELIQSNTDGLIIQIPDTDEAFELIDDICWEWEKRTGMRLGLDVISEIYQKDVNNYLWIEPDGKVECKGAYVKNLSRIDNDLPIVNKALREYMIHGTPPKETINNCDDLMMFQKVVKLSGKYNYVQHNNQKHLYKCYRVFASRSRRDGTIYKVKTGRNPEKFANTPERCFVENDNIVGAKVPDKLDRGWYVWVTKDRLSQYGVEV